MVIYTQWDANLQDLLYVNMELIFFRILKKVNQSSDVYELEMYKKMF